MGLRRLTSFRGCSSICRWPSHSCASSALLRALRERDRAALRIGALLTLFSVFSIASIYYFPDFIHLAFIAPVFLVVLAASIAWTLRLLPPRYDVAANWLAALILMAACGWRLHQNLPGPRPAYVVTYESAFGPIEMHRSEALFYQEIDRLLRDAPSRTLYRHPHSWGTYLILGARNPTRFEFLLSHYHGKDQLAEAIATLRAADVPYVIVDTKWIAPGDPIYREIQERYEPMVGGGLPKGAIWRRRGAPNAQTSPPSVDARRSAGAARLPDGEPGIDRQDD